MAVMHFEDRSGGSGHMSLGGGPTVARPARPSTAGQLRLHSALRTETDPLSPSGGAQLLQLPAAMAMSPPTERLSPLVAKTASSLTPRALAEATVTRGSRTPRRAVKAGLPPDMPAFSIDGRPPTAAAAGLCGWRDLPIGPAASAQARPLPRKRQSTRGSLRSVRSSRSPRSSPRSSRWSSLSPRSSCSADDRARGGGRRSAASSPSAAASSTRTAPADAHVVGERGTDIVTRATAAAFGLSPSSATATVCRVSPPRAPARGRRGSKAAGLRRFDIAAYCGGWRGSRTWWDSPLTLGDPWRRTGDMPLAAGQRAASAPARLWIGSPPRARCRARRPRGDAWRIHVHDVHQLQLRARPAPPAPDAAERAPPTAISVSESGPRYEVPTRYELRSPA